ncbi:MAG: hypothetical protein KDC54_01670, partial [Lewinella sp.]|nr:hypothetical protein [Lewinella sp.]
TTHLKWRTMFPPRRWPCFPWPVAISSDCGPQPIRFYGYSFINPAIARTESVLAPFFLNFTGQFGEYFASQEEIYEKDNATEWWERYCEIPLLADVRFFIYETSQSELETLRAIMRNQDASLRMLGPRLANNSFARYLFRQHCDETIDYLIFAKRCEPHVVATDNPWAESRRDEASMRALIREAKDRFLRTESHYIRLRYAFQAIRLAHYVQDYQLTLDLCEYYLPKIDNDPSLVDYWIQGHKAGALQKLGHRPEAAYLYSRIFDRCPSKRQSAYRSFRIDTDEEWRRALLLCRNDHERATLYVLRAQSDDSDLTEEMQHIYAFDPHHPALQMLLLREVQRLEKDLLGQDINPHAADNRAYYQIPRASAGERVIELQGLIRDWLEEDQLERPELWKVALGYLEVLAGDYYFAQRTFAEAERMVKDKALQEQLAVFRLVLRIVTLSRVNDETERELASLERQYDFYPNYPDFRRLITDKLRTIYRAQGDEGKAYLMEFSLAQLRANPQVDIIDELLFICRKEDRNRFERELVEREDGTTIEYELLDALAAYQLSQGQLEAALETMKEIPTSHWDDYGNYNPFVRRFHDCVECPLPDTVTSFNRGQVIQEMLELEYEARAETDANRSAATYFKLGEAFYNITYFGPAWRATDCFRSSSSAERAYRNKGQEVFSYPGLPQGNREVFNVGRAQFYFDKARSIARDPEIAAAATYMAAKCERNDFYTQDSLRTFENFRLLKEYYSETEFYQRVISECLDFQAYLLK